jgi:PAS domain-containing protein
MMLIDNDDRSYNLKDLEVFNLLKHPIWVFDSERKAMFWANHAALQIWKADSLQSLLSRDFASDMSKSVEFRQKETLAKVSRNEIVQMRRTFYPQGLATTLGVTCSAIRIDGGRIAILTEVEIPDKKAFEESTVRGIEMLRHLPFAVSQFSVDGKLVYQNPEAVNMFGTSPAEISTESAQGSFLSRFVDVDLGRAAF